jgi:transcriptional regulator CtsR
MSFFIEFRKYALSTYDLRHLSDYVKNQIELLKNPTTNDMESSMITDDGSLFKQLSFLRYNDFRTYMQSTISKGYQYNSGRKEYCQSDDFNLCEVNFIDSDGKKEERPYYLDSKAKYEVELNRININFVINVSIAEPSYYVVKPYYSGGCIQIVELSKKYTAGYSTTLLKSIDEVIPLLDINKIIASYLDVNKIQIKEDKGKTFRHPTSLERTQHDLLKANNAYDVESKEVQSMDVDYSTIIIDFQTIKKYDTVIQKWEKQSSLKKQKPSLKPKHLLSKQEKQLEVTSIRREDFLKRKNHKTKQIDNKYGVKDELEFDFEKASWGNYWMDDDYCYSCYDD